VKDHKSSSSHHHKNHEEQQESSTKEKKKESAEESSEGSLEVNPPSKPETKWENGSISTGTPGSTPLTLRNLEMQLMEFKRETYERLQEQLFQIVSVITISSNVSNPIIGISKEKKLGA